MPTPSRFLVQKEIRDKSKRIQRIAKIKRRSATITWHQEEAMRILDLRKIDYVCEKQIFHHESFYLVDIYLPDYNMCVEIDGISHDDPTRSQKDRIRDKNLKEMWYWVFRIRNEDIKYFWYKLKNAIEYSQYMLEKYGSYKKP